MKIIVNKAAAIEQKKEVIDEILSIAKGCANKGLNSFLYHIDRELRYSLPDPHLTCSVENASEGTVCCQARGDAGTSIKFVIRDGSKWREDQERRKELYSSLEFQV